MRRHLFRLYKMLPIRLRRSFKRVLKRLPAGLFEGGMVTICDPGGVPGLVKVWSAQDLPYDAAHLSRARIRAGERIDVPDHDLFVAALRNVDLDLTTGIIHVAGGKLLRESSMDSRLRRAEILRGTLGRTSGRNLSGSTYATIVTLFDRNYYHWFIDTLPRLRLLQLLGPAEPIVLLMPADLRTYEATSLQWCLPPGMSIELVGSEEPLHVERLLMPSNVRERLNAYVPIEFLDHIRSSILRNLTEAVSADSPRRVYISRAYAGRRRVLNENAVVKCLAIHGFDVVHAERLSLEEQVALFRNVEWIVGPHGAGLTNMLFSDHTRVLEFLGDPNPDARHFLRLAASLGHDHRYLHVVQRGKEGDITVDIGELERSLADWNASAEESGYAASAHPVP